MPGKRARLFVILLAGLLVAAAAVPAYASKCSARKLTAAARYFDALARCEAKAVAKRRSPDPLCFGRAQAKLIAGQEKAESKGACLTVGDVVPLQDVLDDALAAAVDVVETPPARTCCSTGGNACHWSATAAACMNLGGTPGAPVTEQHRRDLSEAEQQLAGIEKLRAPRSDLPAITHVDDSARGQTVDLFDLVGLRQE